MFARTPAGCSYMSTRDARRRFIGIFSDDSMDRNSLKFGCGLSASSRFSSDCNHAGVRWTFLTKTHDPEEAALLTALSAVARPSVEPIAIFVQLAPICCTKLSTL